MAEDEVLKLLLVGNSGVGKTVLLSRYCGEEFRSEFISTVGIDYKAKLVNRNGVEMNLQIWDTAGQERYQSISKAYYRGASGVVIVFDITDDTSFTAVQTWVDSIKDSVEEETTHLILVGNKTDLSENRVVSEEEAQELADSLGLIGYVETSGKDDTNITKVFEMLLDAINGNPRSEKAEKPQEPSVESPTEPPIRTPEEIAELEKGKFNSDSVRLDHEHQSSHKHGRCAC